MFVLDKSKFFDKVLINAEDFINVWRKYYNYVVKDENGKDILYIEDLNLNNNLTEQNIKRLLRWKDPHMLTEKIQSGKNEGSNNKKVEEVLKNFKNINDFRFGKISEDDFKGVTENIFKTGIVWRIFLFHISRPLEYPIADQNVFRVFFLLNDIKKDPTKAKWEDYIEYKKFFFDIAKYAGIIDHELEGNEKNIRNIVERLKKVDDALFEFGKFLKKYKDSH